jgi:hypothetical protein
MGEAIGRTAMESSVSSLFDEQEHRFDPIGNTLTTAECFAWTGTFDLVMFYSNTLYWKES